jgi:CHAT domain-containing protein/lipopolysaccharide biosynthesis regulator YciM
VGHSSDVAAQTELELKKTIEREISAEQPHLYQITLARGQWAGVSLEAHGIELLTTVLAPDGKTIFQYENEIGSRVEQISFVADTTAIYSLKIQARYQRANGGGRYQIQLTEVREATDHDRSLNDAQRLATEVHQLRRAGKYEQAVRLAEQSLALREQALGPDNLDVAESAYDLAFVLANKGDYKKAEPLYQRAVAIAEKIVGPENPRLARYLLRFAYVYSYKGDYSHAEELLQRALQMDEKLLGREHPVIATILEQLAALSRTRGDFARAERLFERSLLIAEDSLGPDDVEVARILNSFGSFCREKGDYVKAEPMLQRVLAIYEKTFGVDHPNYASALNNLANLYRDRREYDKAEPLYLRALSIKEKAWGPDHADVARYRDNLASVYFEKREYAKAEPLYLSALKTWEKKLGPEHPMVGRVYSNLGRLYFELKDYEKSEQFYLRALLIYENALGENFYYLATILTELAKTSEAGEKFPQAVAYLARASAVFEYNVRLNLASGSERQKIAYLDQLPEQLNQTVSLHVRFSPADPIARDLAATTLLRHKGRLQDALSNSLSALRSRFSAKDKELLDQLNDINSKLAELVLNGPREKGRDEYQKQIQALESKREELESQVSRRSEGFYQQIQPVTLDAIRSAIPDQAALVEFAIYRPYVARPVGTQKRFEDAQYVAYIIRHQGDVQWKELGSAQLIDDAIDQFRRALRDPKRKDVQELARVVDERVMEPVRAAIGDSTQLIISPDGALNLIPFNALVDERDRYLNERFSFSYVTSGRDLLRMQITRPGSSLPLVLADPLFGEPEMQIARVGGQRFNRTLAERKRQSVTSGADMSQVYFTPLSGTQLEAQAIKFQFPDAVVATALAANETLLKQVAAPRILHVATHGFFLTDKPLSGSGESIDGKRGISAKASVDNPLLRSGLALAGANLRKSGDDDGILTALEASGLNLWGTKLVTLSACDTGLGEVKNGEGVYGLRRAFVLAGTETLVMSLWPVSDFVTRDLMTGYYRGLKQGQGRAEALRNVQLEMLKRKERSHPFYWASFIQSGEWANLDGKRQ